MEARLIQNISNAPAYRLMPDVPATLTERLLCAMCLLCFGFGKLVTCEQQMMGDCNSLFVGIDAANSPTMG